MSAPSPSPRYWLSRTEEARVVAEQMQHPEARLSMLQIARIYIGLALRAFDSPEKNELPN
jgi:hypothetical protein